ncbi:MAG: hypothetical protein ACIAQZ_00675 [Sedimentisphaeraceae bacterium JB056]
MSNIKATTVDEINQIELPPEMIGREPGSGKRVRQVAAEYRGTCIHHSLYLPLDWQPDKKYPVMVEYTGNYYPGSGSTGKVEDANLGYGLCGAKGWIWVVLPFIAKDHKHNEVTWWGDKQAAIDYCTINIPRICERFGGDMDSLFLCGFSRGAIAVNYIGLADERIASMWKGFITHDHYDGVKEDWRYEDNGRESALERLKLLDGRRQLICANKDEFSQKTREYLSDKNKFGDFTFIDVPVEELFDIPNQYFISSHTDLWMSKDSDYRRRARQWLLNII